MKKPAGGCCRYKAIRRYYQNQKEKYYIHRVSSRKSFEKIQGKGKVHKTSQRV